METAIKKLGMKIITKVIFVLGNLVGCLAGSHVLILRLSLLLSPVGAGGGGGRKLREYLDTKERERERRRGKRGK